MKLLASCLIQLSAQHTLAKRRHKPEKLGLCSVHSSAHGSHSVHVSSSFSPFPYSFLSPPAFNLDPLHVVSYFSQAHFDLTRN